MRLFIFVVLLLLANSIHALPPGFVYLRDIDPSILQDMRYAGAHNFIGRPIAGYENAECILTLPTALALTKVQTALRPSGLALKVYDCYRPVRSVADFLDWSKQPEYQEMKAEFYPLVNKADFFRLGYVAEKSGHSRGSTVDLTIVPFPAAPQPEYHPSQRLLACTAPYPNRYPDSSIDMGTGFDCMDELSHALNKNVGPKALANRLQLREIMLKNGFLPYEAEWWHFTLKNEPYPATYFDFVVRKE